MAKPSMSFIEVLEEMRKNTEGEKVTVGELLDAFDARAYGPLLLVPSLLAISPAGAIPGMSLLTGAIILCIAVQMLFAVKQPWLPNRLKSFEFSREKLKKTIEWLKKPAGFIEKFIHSRLVVFVKPPFIQIIAAICAIMALTMWPLALLPFAVAVPGTTILLFAMGITTHDGVLIVAGFALAAVTVWLTVFYAL